MVSKSDPRRHNGFRVYVRCEIVGRQNGTAEVRFHDRVQRLTTRADRLSLHPDTKESLCAAKLLYTKQGLATILFRKVDDQPVEIQVLNGRVYCEERGKLVKFRSWKELLQRRKENKRGKERKRQKRLTS